MSDASVVCRLPCCPRLMDCSRRISEQNGGQNHLGRRRGGHGGDLSRDESWQEKMAGAKKTTSTPARHTMIARWSRFDDRDCGRIAFATSSRWHKWRGMHSSMSAPSTWSTLFFPGGSFFSEPHARTVSSSTWSATAYISEEDFCITAASLCPILEIGCYNSSPGQRRWQMSRT